MLGEYGSLIPEAPYVIENIIDGIKVPPSFETALFFLSSFLSSTTELSFRTKWPLLCGFSC